MELYFVVSAPWQLILPFPTSLKDLGNIANINIQSLLWSWPLYFSTMLMPNIKQRPPCTLR
eukprot:NODE_2776_length_869_cov_92.596341_g2289_i0.p3 GENE.NODE_2776_length_869_cov_92.596341_g2289_i0~~NODE_2776_length_869_cov_92.596341_g2289_i0.p3  ORF type:complete len:61 (-),score=2.43 NODE_2776_length_869_cov_92.596341_g2289_i0:17-199(-)